MRRRVDWLDAARGFAVAAVVLYHVASVLVDHYGLGEAGVGRGWRALGYLLSGVRLPLLLLVSGAVLSGQVRRGFARSTTGFRVVQLGYLYVLWTCVYWVAMYREGTLAQYVGRAPTSLARQLLVPATPVWFLAALALYVLLATAVRHLPRWLVLAPLLVLAAWAAGLNLADFETWRSVPQYAFSFMLGVYAGRRVQRVELLDRRRWWVASLLGATSFAVLMAVSRRLPPGLGAGMVEVLGSLAGVVTAVLLIERACRYPPVRRLGSAIGRRTIAVYLLHSLLFLAVLHLVHPWVEDALEAWPDAMLLVAPPLVSLALIGVCLLVEQTTRRIGLSFLWQLPGPVSRALGRPAGRPTGAVPASPS